MKKIKRILALMAVISVIVLQYSAEATRETKDPHEVDRLIGDLKDASWQIRWYAAEALANITGRDFGKDPVKRQEWWEKNK
jgi:HEAT repeat protein